MKQVLQSYRTGELSVAEVPAPVALPGMVLVRTAASLVSAGTEKMVMDLAKKSLVGKARERPDLVQKVVEKVARDGVVATAQAVLAKLDVPIPLGYSLAGTVVEVGAGVSTLAVGDRVACAGAKAANHAEFNAVPVNLCARIPDGVPDEDASFVTLGAIALHGLRCAAPTLGERVAVIGLGLIGQLAIQLARAHGCRTIGVDVDARKVELARSLGADEAVTRDGDVDGAVARLCAGRGVDAVLICAATPSSDPVELAATLSRDRGRIVAVGAVGLDLPRRPFFDKELSLVVSRAYGPGRYDPRYEEQGIDYPLGYVRWTEGRNLEAFLELCAEGKLRVGPLVTHRFPIAAAGDAYRLIDEAKEPFLGVVLTYDAAATPRRTVEVAPEERGRRGRGLDVRVGVIGAGGFATSVLVPALARAKGARLSTIASARGISARHLAGRFRFARCSSDARELLADPALDAVVIATRHDLHAAQATAALAAGKHVFVEKPPALSVDELRVLKDGAVRAGRVLAVGYNRRFAPLAVQLRAFLDDRTGPLVLHYRVNAGPIPADSWIHDRAIGGGRIVGEVCHFVDLVSYVCRAVPVRVHAAQVSGAVAPTRDDDQVALTLKLSDGSIATITYASGGDPSYPKERLEVIGAGRVATLDDFRTLELARGGKRTGGRSFSQDKGHRAELQAFVDACRSGDPPVELASLVATSLATFAALRSLESGGEIAIDADRCELAPAGR